jgi:prepilin-type N-terminal cleavage/methylation domain-containing protein
MPRSTPHDESGFTLIELLVTMVLASILGTTGLFALQTYSQAQDHQGTADEVVSELRLAGQRSLSEGRTYCVHFDTGTDAWTVWRSECSTVGGTPVSDPQPARGLVQLDSPSFAPADPTAPCPQTNACAYLYPRGTGSPGSVDVVRDGTTITVTVEGLTSRVSRS